MGSSSHKKRRQHTRPSADLDQADGAAVTALTHPDSNREVIVPGSAEEEAWKAKEKMRKEVR